MDKIAYPKWKYHASQPAMIVGNEDAERALEPGWFDSPAEIDPPAHGFVPDSAAKDAPEMPESRLIEKIEDALHIPHPPKRTRRAKS